MFNLTVITTKISRMLLLTGIIILLVNSFAMADLVTGDSTANSITLRWTAPGDDGDNGTASSYDIRYSTAIINEGNWSSATQVSGEPVPQAAGTAESFVVTGLQSATTYYMAIKAADEASNWSALSNVVIKITAIADTPPANVTNLVASNPSRNSMVLTWTAPGANGNQGTASQYDIRYSTATITESNWTTATQIHNEPTPLVAGTTQNVTISGLSALTTYYFALKTADSTPNWSGLSNIASGTTSAAPDETAPSVIAGLLISRTSADSVTLTWTAPGDDTTSGTATLYDIRYSTALITTANWSTATQVSGEPVPAIAGTTQSDTIRSLAQETTYYFAIKTADEVPNVSGLSNVVSATIADYTPPAAIDDLVATTGDELGSISISWYAPGDDGNNGVAQSYVIKTYTQPITEQNWNLATAVSNPPAPLVSGSAQDMTVGDLVPGTVYYSAMKAVDNYGNLSAISNISSAEAMPMSSEGIDDEGAIPTEYNLSQNYPNPFNPTTNIDFSLPERSSVTMEIYDSMGRKVTTLVDDHYEAGYYSITWDGHNDNGGAIATGVYFCRIVADGYASTKKMMYLK